jgi:hypothetical protein
LGFGSASASGPAFKSFCALFSKSAAYFALIKDFLVEIIAIANPALAVEAFAGQAELAILGLFHFAAALVASGVEAPGGLSRCCGPGKSVFTI